ncbi:MAG: class I SAM-dependent methyltransferase [Novosphingobium sp.]|nr:class I SAM-dependent methyltransferase [Novosphingobium sp.]
MSLEARPIENSDWHNRLALMDEWYHDLLSQGRDEAEAELLYWFEPHAEYLSNIRGRIVDLGGGVGLLGRFLDPGCEYTVVDPNALWDSQDWRDFGHHFTGNREVKFVSAKGEDLPFPDASFDAGLSYSSLNHVADVELCIAELARVVRKSGKILLVLEDMEPSWADIVRGALEWMTLRLGLIDRKSSKWQIDGFKKAVRNKLSGKPWAISDEHFLIREADLRQWLAPHLKIVSRSWRGLLLTYELVRVE